MTLFITSVAAELLAHRKIEKFSLTETVTTLPHVYHIPCCLIYWYFSILYWFPQLLLG